MQRDERPSCMVCNGLVKPDIVFFGEDLPSSFYQLSRKDFSKCDLLIVMGTSLTIRPFSSLIDKVEFHCPRLLINRQPCGIATESSDGFEFYEDLNHRDVYFEGDCDEGCKQLASLCGFNLSSDDENNAIALTLDDRNKASSLTLDDENKAIALTDDHKNKAISLTYENKAIALLDSLKIPYKIMELHCAAISAADVLSNSIGHVNPDEVCKTIILHHKQELFPVLLKGSDKIDIKKLSKMVEKKMKILCRDKVLELTGMQVGSVCPFLFKTLYVDERVMTLQRLNVGSSDLSFGLEIETKDLSKVTGIKVGDLVA